MKAHGIQEAIKDLDQRIIQVRSEIGRRLDGAYQLKLHRMRSVIR
jgi:hypothetical protein